MSDVQQRAMQAFHPDDVEELRAIPRANPELKELVSGAEGDFGLRLTNCVRSKAMLDVLIEAGVDLNGRSDRKPGSFGMLETVEPDIALMRLRRVRR